MAILKPLNGKGRYHDTDDRDRVAQYILNPQKTPHRLIAGFHIDSSDAVGSMNAVAEKWGKQNGVQLRHFILAFYPQECNDPLCAFQIGKDILWHIGQEYQSIFAVHENTANLHIHLMLNSISYQDGHRYYGTRRDYYTLINCIKSVLRPYGIHKLMAVSPLSEQDIQD